MNRVGRFLSFLISLAVLSLAAQPAAAQRVARIDPIDDEITIEVGATFETFVDAYNAQGQLVTVTQADWTSSNSAVVQVVPAADAPEVATLVAISPGQTTVQVTIGNVTATIRVTVTGQPGRGQPPAGGQPPPAAAVPDSVLTPQGANTLSSNSVRIEAVRFGAPNACETGVITDQQGLILTTYTAIRGANRLTAITGDGRSLGAVQVAAYDVQQNLAVLRVAIAQTQGASLIELQSPAQYAWSVGFPNCGSAAQQRLAVNSVTPDLSAMTLSVSLPSTYNGGPVINNQGQIIGLVQAGTAAAGVRPLNNLLVAAANATPQTPLQVAQAEGHAYGSVVIRAPGLLGARLRVTPAGNFAWEGIGGEGPAPYTLAGPAGAYNVELLIAGQVEGRSTIRVQQGVTTQESITRTQIARGQQPQQPARQPPGGGQPQAAGGGGGFPVPLLIVALLGGGAAAFFATQKPGNGPCTPGVDPNCPTNGNGKGTITIVVPNP